VAVSILYRVAVLSTLVLVAACGGGGDGQEIDEPDQLEERSATIQPTVCNVIPRPPACL
jgi:hypothetical protein